MEPLSFNGSRDLGELVARGLPRKTPDTDGPLRAQELPGALEAVGGDHGEDPGRVTGPGDGKEHAARGRARDPRAGERRAPDLDQVRADHGEPQLLETDERGGGGDESEGRPEAENGDAGGVLGIRPGPEARTGPYTESL